MTGDRETSSTSPREAEEESYRPLALRALRLEAVADFDIYLRTRAGRPWVLYREKHLSFTEEVRERLEANGVTKVYVPASQERLLRAYIERNLGNILDDEQVEAEEKAHLVYDTLVWLTEDLMSDPRAGDVVPRSKQMVQNTCKFLYDQRDALEHFIRVSTFDYSIFTHSVNVFVFSLALAQRLFPEELVRNEFGLGALLHDIGKTMIDPEILNCKGKLTDAQFEVMKMHPVYSYEILKEKGSLHPLVLDMARHHHERIKGGGYPDNLQGDAIAKEVRILTIADIFDALTTQRSYKDAMPSFPALKLMRDQMGDAIDPALFRTFVDMMGRPSG